MYADYRRFLRRRLPQILGIAIITLTGFSHSAAVPWESFRTSIAYSQEVTIDITKRGLTKIKIAIDSNLSRELEELLISDLTLSDYFKPQKTKIGAEILLQCTQTGSLTIEGKLYETNKNQMILGKRFSGTPKQGPKLIHSLSDSIVNAVTGETGIAQTKLAFEHKEKIYASDYDGANLRAIIKDNCLNLFPEWSPKGDKLVYTSYLYGYPQTFIYDLTKARRNRICGYPGLNTSASFSPDGKKIALTLSKDGNPEIYTINVGGTGLRRITRERGVDTSPCWSPDGRRIAFVSNRGGSPQIYIVNSGGGTAKRITYSGSYNTNPSWSPKGDVIAYNSIINGIFQICIIEVETGNSTQITSGRDNHECPSFAPDGRHIVFSLTKGYNKYIYIMDIYYREPHKLKMKGGNYTHPDWGK